MKNFVIRVSGQGGVFIEEEWGQDWGEHVVHVEAPDYGAVHDLSEYREACEIAARMQDNGILLTDPAQAFELEPGRYDLLTHEPGHAGCSGWYLNDDGTINTYHNVGTWSSVDQCEASAEELETQCYFPCVVVRGE